MKIWLIDSEFDLHKEHLPGPTQPLFKPLSHINNLLLSVIHKVILHMGGGFDFPNHSPPPFLGAFKIFLLPGFITNLGYDGFILRVFGPA
jgi:hypothetical protein